MTLTEEEQRGLVIMSALLNFADWLADEKILLANKSQRGQLVKRFLASHSEGKSYFLKAEDIAKRLGVPFKMERKKR